MKNRISWLFGSKVLLAFFVLFATLLLVFAHKLYRDRKHELNVSIQNNLKAIAELKAGEIHTWLKERMSDVNVLSHSNFYPDLSIFTGRMGDSVLQLKAQLTIVRQHYNYDEVILLDLHKNVVLCTNEGLTTITPAAKQMLNELEGDKACFKLYRNEESQKIILDFYSAVVNHANEILGYLILRSDPEKYLYPTINRWPVVSKTAEANLVERSGDSLRSLNHTKYRIGPVLKSRLSLKQTDNPGVNAILGGLNFLKVWITGMCVYSPTGFR
jgi:hypothetical protein